MDLNIDGEYLAAKTDEKTKRVAKVSKSRVEKWQKLEWKDFKLNMAAIRFVVAWKGEEDTEETAVILLDLFLKRENG